ncbi:MAG: patatin-like phospholipase family protein [Gaiella sp.]|nr:patatin-like phospholipase family protein [Gaiella sp.]
MSDRDLALVLSGGGMNGLLLELGFLQRVRQDPLWERVGFVYGTSAGALSGVMAALDRLDELEEFVLALRPEETFRPNRLWQTPLNGLHDYVLPETIAERLAPADDLARDLAEAPVELVVTVTDVTDGALPDELHAYERIYSSRTTPVDVMARAVLASAAISALVLPLRVGDVIGTDGGWVRNFPLGHAYDNPAVAEIVGFRYISRTPTGTGDNLPRLRRRLERFRAVPPVRALIGELRAAEERQERGEPPHLADMIVRLMRVTVARNTELEVRSAHARDASVRALAALEEEVVGTVTRSALPWRREAAAAEVRAHFSSAHFPFRHDRALPRTIVRGDPGELSLDSSFRTGLEWPLEAKKSVDRTGLRADGRRTRRARRLESEAARSGGPLRVAEAGRHPASARAAGERGGTPAVGCRLTTSACRASCRARPPPASASRRRRRP